MLKVCLVVDTESFISFGQVNPMWNFSQRISGKINYLLRNLRYDRRGFERMHALALQHQFPITFMLVGSIFQPKGKEKFIEYGYHSYSHRPLTFLSDDELKKEVRNRHHAASFSPPLWMIEDVKNPSRIFAALKKEKYKVTIYRGKINGITPASRITKGIFPPVTRHGMKAIYVSAVFSAGTPKQEMNRILREIRQNARRNAVYCLTTHDFANKDMDNFLMLLTTLKQMEKAGLITLVTVKETVR